MPPKATANAMYVSKRDGLRALTLSFRGAVRSSGQTFESRSKAIAIAAHKEDDLSNRRKEALRNRPARRAEVIHQHQTTAARTINGCLRQEIPSIAKYARLNALLNRLTGEQPATARKKSATMLRKHVNG